MASGEVKVSNLPSLPPQQDYFVCRQYWSNLCEENPELCGVAGIGGAGHVEVLYRHHEELRHLKNMVGFDRSMDVLEIGAGNGRWALSLAPCVNSYVAVDFSRQMLDLAQVRAAKRKIRNIFFVEASAQDYTPEQSFDIIYFSGVTQYLHDADLDTLLERLLAVLKPGGIVIDRSTVSLNQTCRTAASGYFSIYRTTDAIRQIYSRSGLQLYYNNPSYRFLNFPDVVQWLLMRRISIRLVALCAPLSFVLLRCLSVVSSALFRPRGELLDFSHDFFLFCRKVKDDAHV